MKWMRRVLRYEGGEGRTVREPCVEMVKAEGDPDLERLLFWLV